MTREFETEVCGRCGGTGHHSRCESYGTTCFKCKGRKKVYTKRGQAAYDRYILLKSKIAANLAVGDVVRSSFTGQWCTISAIKPDTTVCRSFVNGVEVPVRTDLLRIETDRVDFGGISPESVFEVKVGREAAIELMGYALDYQETLTKQGTPRRQK